MLTEIVGHAIVSADGMIANALGEMPKDLRVDADWQRFQAALSRSALVVLGRKAHGRHPNPGRRRLVLTRSVATLAPDPGDSNATLWNPSGIAFRETLTALALPVGPIAITGVFDVFLPYFTGFDLVTVDDFVLPGGTPCFVAGKPEGVLAGAGLQVAGTEVLEQNVVLTRWVRSIN